MARVGVGRGFARRSGCAARSGGSGPNGPALVRTLRHRCRVRGRLWHTPGAGCYTSPVAEGEWRKTCLFVTFFAIRPAPRTAPRVHAPVRCACVRIPAPSYILLLHITGCGQGSGANGGIGDVSRRTPTARPSQRTRGANHAHLTPPQSAQLPPARPRCPPPVPGARARTAAPGRAAPSRPDTASRAPRRR